MRKPLLSKKNIATRLNFGISRGWDRRLLEECLVDRWGLNITIVLNEKHYIGVNPKQCIHNMSLIPTVQHGAGVIIVWGLFSASVPVAAGETFLRWGLWHHWHSKQFHKQFFTINQIVRLIWTQLLYLRKPKFSSQTDIGVQRLYRFRFVSGINNTWVRHCYVIENCATTDHETSLDFSSLGRQKIAHFS